MSDSPNGEWIDVDSMPAMAGIRSAQSFERLNQIDRVRAYGVGERVPLPQFVVGGDQSAWKSSVLEAITGIPFPRKEGMCTRFPTEIILRHEPGINRITATINPAGIRSEDEKESLRSFRWDLKDFNELPQVIEDVACLIGVRDFVDTADAPAFAADALRLEYIGNTGLNLTVVDLPGLISVSDNGDEEVVMALVDSYLESSRTVILAIMQAGNDIENQSIIQRARQFDPDGERTVGIITKPDLINKTTESRVAELLKNQGRLNLKLGFFLLKNPTPEQLNEKISPAQRAELETAFFNSNPWKAQDLDYSRVGADNLRVHLQTLLNDHVERQIPGVRNDVATLLSKTEKQLQDIGPERSSTSQIRVYLSGVSMCFHNLAVAALEGNYCGQDWSFFAFQADGWVTLNEYPTRLRANVHHENGKFAEKMRNYSEKRKAVDPDDPSVDLLRTLSEKKRRKGLKSDQMLVTEKEMTDWVKNVYRNTRGRELPGNYNHALLTELFHQQSCNWKGIAQNHLKMVLRIVEEFVERALNHVVQDETVRQNVRKLVEPRLRKHTTAAEEELEKLLEDEKGHPLSYNHYYTDNIQKARTDSQKKAIQNWLKESTKPDGYGGHRTTDGIEKLAASFEHRIIVDMDEQACSEALIGLHAYYKVAMKTFVDNVCRQVIERHVLKNLGNVFGPVFVSDLTDDDVHRIASESSQTRKRRSKLQSLKANLERSSAELRE